MVINEVMNEFTVEKSIRYYLYRMKELLQILFALEPIMINVIALVLCGVMLFVLGFRDAMPNLGKYHSYLYHGIQFLACYQVIMSGKKSLMLPLLTILIAGIGVAAHRHSVPLPIDLSILKDMVVVGIVGTALSIFHMR
jgi:hypothetical protein